MKQTMKKYSLLLLLLMNSQISAQEPYLSIVPSASESYRKGLNRAFRSIGIRPEEVRLRDDYLPRDPFRFAIVDRWMTQPLIFPGEIDLLCEDLLDNNWYRRFITLGNLYEIPIETFSVVQKGVNKNPNFEQIVKLNWQNSKGKIPRSVKKFLSKSKKILPDLAQEAISKILFLHYLI